MTMTNLEHTKALEAAATPGPWEIIGGGEFLMPLAISVGVGSADVSLRDADAEFIAHARTAVPALVAAVERVQALHSPWPSPSIQTYCRTCAHPMPCPTRQALEGP